VDRLLDPGTPFLELAPLAAGGMYGDESPEPESSPGSPGLRARMRDRGNDATVKGGTYYR